MKKVLTIAGSDCSGGAGIQADLKTFSAHGVFGMSVVTSIVAENTSRVIDYEDVSPELIEKQMLSIYEDIGTDSVKIGMLSGEKTMRAVVKSLKEFKPKNVVIDPVMYAKNGCALMDPSSIDVLIKEVLPMADLITPNIPEAEHIANMKIKNLEDMKTAAIKIKEMGPSAVLIKGGHSEVVTDVLYDGTDFSTFEGTRIDTKNTHGTGCTLSSAIASNLALGYSMSESVGRAKKYIQNVIEHSLEIGKGNGPTHHFYTLYRGGLKAMDELLSGKRELDANSELESEIKPLIHVITNYVTANDSANAILAAGGTPVMADDSQESADMTKNSDALVLNMGTMSKKKFKAMIKSGKAANKKGIPVILDMVGAGATDFRNEFLEKILEDIKLDIVHGNSSEVDYLIRKVKSTRGVDSTSETTIYPEYHEFVKSKDIILVISGEVDYILSNVGSFSIKNGSVMMKKITGTGCMLTSLIGTYAGAGMKLLDAAINGTLTMGIAGELAEESAGNKPGSFRTALIDEISAITPDIIEKRKKINEI